jgi:hypothetical protein
VSATPWKRAGWPRLQTEWIGRRARALRQLSNGYMTIPKGAELTIGDVSNSERIRLLGGACATCGITAHISGVSWRDLELLPKEAIP